MDNFYTSVILFTDLMKEGITACGTMLLNRKSMPAHFTDIKTLERAIGSSRYFRDGNLLFVQWRYNQIVIFLSTMHTKSKEAFFYCKRRSKVGNCFQKLDVEQPKLVNDYNKYMAGVDRSDQIIGKYNTLRRTDTYWKTFFFIC